MILVIFICQKRYEYFNLLKVFDEKKHRFIALLQKNSDFHISKAEENIFEKIINVDTLTDKCISQIIEDEIQQGFHPNNIRIVCPDELRLLMAAQLREKYKIPGEHENTLLFFRDKILMKERLQNSNVRVPKFLKMKSDHIILSVNDLFNELKSKIGTPFLFKPINGASSFGVKVISNTSELQDWLKSIVNINEYEAEEFINGKLFHCDSFVNNGIIQFCSISQYMFPCLDFTLGKPMGTMPLIESSPIFQAIHQFNERIIQVMGLGNGVTHLELFVAQNTQEIIFVEIAARPSGGPVVKLLENTYGVNLYELSLRLELSETIRITKKQPKEFYAACYLPVRKGKIAALIEPTLNCNYILEWEVTTGEIVNSDADSVVARRAGIVWFNGDYDAVSKDFEYLKTFTPISYESIADN